MGLLDKIGHVALDALDAAVRLADRERKSAPEPSRPAPPPAPKPAPVRAQEIGDGKIPVQVFGRMTCPWTQRALRLLGDRSIEHVYTELAEVGGFALVPRLVAATGQRTVPYVYLRGRFIGGYDALDEIDRLGQLDDMIKSDEERAASRDKTRTRIQVAPQG